ncbi:MAG: peptidoglycan DD-metalloendopeptidase family protein [Hyphomicrobiaceae bacterium]
MTVSLAGCSTDIGRFESQGVAYNGDNARTAVAGAPTPSEPIRRNNAGIPVESDPGYDRPAGGAPYTPPPGAREPAVRLSGLPDPVARPEPGTTAPPPAARARPLAPPAARAPAAPAAPTAPAPATAGRQVPTIATTPGETIEVAQGDTLYGIAKRHRVAISELMTLNNLTNPAIRPGQKIVLPAGKRAVAARPAAAPAAPVTAAAPAAPAPPVRAATPAAPATPPSDWTGSYTVAQGDSIYAIARRHKVKPDDLQSINGITDPGKVRPGTVLKVPGAPGAPAAAAPPVVAAAPEAPSAPAAKKPAGGARPTIINAPQAGAPAAPENQRVAALNPGTATDAPAADAAAPQAPAAKSDAPKASGASRFRWPVKGKVIAGFGPRPDNTHNDGINISVPAGTDVLAAENGVVAYAGNELKGYGNLVLVRHENNWVSAYAHNDTLTVKRGDKVKRGQPIAKAGNSGAVDQPQVHFELRQGSKPVDPMPHMEAN